MDESYETKLFFSMTSNKIEYLPIEIIDIILEDKDISITDIMRLKSTCKRLQRITLSNHFWKKKFCQRCPTARKYCAQKPKNTFDYLNFEDLIKTGIKYVKKIQYYVLLMSDNNLSIFDKKDLESFLLYIVGNSKLIYFFVLDEIHRMSSTECHLSWSIDDQNLTLKYNLKLIVHFLKLYRYTYNNIKQFCKPTINSPVLERLITIVAQYFRPHVSYSVIKMWLDNISQEVLDRVEMKHPSHPIFSTSAEQFVYWKNNNINDHFWNSKETMQIMCELEKYIFSELDIHKLLELLIISDREDKHILFDYISDFFSKYLLIVTYHSVARRLGIHCILHSIYTDEYTNFKDETLIIIWKQRSDTTKISDNAAEYFYIQKLSKSELIYPLNIIKGKYVHELSFEVYDNKWQSDITCNHIIPYINTKLYKYGLNYKWKLEKISNIMRNIQYKTVIHSACLYDDVWIKDYYEHITDIIQVRSYVKPKERSEEIKFAVGMIVTYRSRDLDWSNRSITYGVIIGWRDRSEDSREIDVLPFLDQSIDTDCANRKFFDSDEPYYIILAENNKVYYGVQSMISKCPPKEIYNLEIGRYFYKFEGTHYVPNKKLRQQYPYDISFDISCECVTNLGKCCFDKYIDGKESLLNLDICCQACCPQYI